MAGTRRATVEPWAKDPTSGPAQRLSQSPVKEAQSSKE